MESRLTATFVSNTQQSGGSWFIIFIDYLKHVPDWKVWQIIKKALFFKRGYQKMKMRKKVIRP